MIESYIEGFHDSHVGGLKKMKQFCMKIDLIPHRRENVFLPSNMAAVTSHENALYGACTCMVYCDDNIWKFIDLIVAGDWCSM